jgi:hypothetical protein
LRECAFLVDKERNFRGEDKDNRDQEGERERKFLRSQQAPVVHVVLCSPRWWIPRKGSKETDGDGVVLVLAAGVLCVPFEGSQIVCGGTVAVVNVGSTAV